MKVFAVFKRVLKEMLHDQRTLLLMFIAPLLIMTLLNFLFKSSTTETATLGVRQVDSSLVKQLSAKHLRIKKTSSQATAKSLVKKKGYDGLLSQTGRQLTLTLQNTDQSKKRVILQSLQQGKVKLSAQETARIIKKQGQALTNLQGLIGRSPARTAGKKQSKTNSPGLAKPKNYRLKTYYLYGNQNTNYFDSLMPIMISFIVFFFVFLITGMSLLHERSRGTLDRILATPIRKGELVAGYILGYGLFAIVQTLEIVCFTIYVFRIEIIGSIWLILGLNLLVAFVGLSLGILLSAFANSEFQMMQFIPIVVVPQIFFAGIIPVSSMAGWLQVLAHLTPMYYAGNAMLKVVQEGYDLSEVGSSCLLLLLFGLVFITLAVLDMRKYREV